MDNSFVITIGNNFEYNNGCNYNNSLQAGGTFSKDLLKMSIFSDDISIENIEVNFYLDHNKKIIWITDLVAQFIDIFEDGDQLITLANFDTFHLRDEVFGVFKHILRVYLGAKWKLEIGGVDDVLPLIIQDNSHVIPTLQESRLPQDICHEVMRHVVRDALLCARPHTGA